jgi:hypothetical protein
MARTKKPNIKVSANASAKVAAVAKASYARKRTTTEIIPPDVTRAKARAWLDLVSTEWAGLKGDQLRLKRDQLRLQREDILAEIISRARERIGSLENVDKPIPNKFIVPFLEHASLEGQDSSLIDMWANLLASAAQNFSSYHSHFVSIISQLSAKQGEILKSIIGTESAYECEVAKDNIITHFQGRHIRQSIEQTASELTEQTDKAFFTAIERLFDRAGVEVVGISVENIETRAFFSITPEYQVYADDDEVDYSILEAVGLIRRVDTEFFDVENWAISVVYYHLTDLGFHFSLACGLVRPDEEPFPPPIS